MGCAHRSSRNQAEVRIESQRQSYCSASHFIDVFSTYYGPVHKAFAMLDEVHQNSLRHDIIGLIASMNAANDGTMVVPAEHLEIVTTKR